MFVQIEWKKKLEISKNHKIDTSWRVSSLTKATNLFQKNPLFQVKEPIFVPRLNNNTHFVYTFKKHLT